MSLLVALLYLLISITCLQSYQFAHSRFHPVARISLLTKSSLNAKNFPSTSSKASNCKTCSGKEGINCAICKGTGIDKANGNIFERWYVKLAVTVARVVNIEQGNGFDLLGHAPNVKVLVISLVLRAQSIRKD
jgi:hypothetical protein